MLTTVILFLVLLSLLVLIHEFGHFIAAKKSGVGVDEFGIGFPPRIFAREWRGTIYSVNWLPIGGFVRIKGEVSDENDPKILNAPDSFANLSFLKKMAIVTAGVFMNIVLAMVLFGIGYMVGLPQMTDDLPANATVTDEAIRIQAVEDGSSADSIGLAVGDQIVSLNGAVPDEVEDIINFTLTHPDEQIELVVLRDETEQIFNPTLNRTETDEGRLGVALIETGTVSYPPFTAVWLGIKTAVVLLWEIIVAFWNIIVNLFAGVGPGDSVAGPIGIAVLTGQVASLGAIYLLQFAAILSLNLAIFNLIPFPALDGGRIVITVVEKIRGKALRQSLEGWIHQIGFFILLLLVLVITVRDISVYSERILGFVQSIF